MLLYWYWWKAAQKRCSLPSLFWFFPPWSWKGYNTTPDLSCTLKEMKNGVHWSGEQLPSEYRCLDVIVTQANFTACSKNKSGSPRRKNATNARDYFASPHVHHKNSNLLFKALKLLHLGCGSGWQRTNLHHLGFFNVHIDRRICAYKILQPKSGIEPAIFGVPVQRLGR